MGRTAMWKAFVPLAAALLHPSLRPVVAASLPVAFVGTAAAPLSAAFSPLSSSPLPSAASSAPPAAASSALACERQQQQQQQQPLASPPQTAAQKGVTTANVGGMAAAPSPSTGNGAAAAAASPSGVRAAFITVPDADTAEKIANKLVSEKVAACVNIIPGVKSVYEWKGSIEKDSEVLLMVKTTTDRFAAMRKAVLDIHPYDCPEVIGFDVADGNANYLQWVKTVAAGRPPPSEKTEGK